MQESLTRNTGHFSRFLESVFREQGDNYRRSEFVLVLGKKKLFHIYQWVIS